MRESIRKYYEHENEDGRLRLADGEIEFLRTKDILLRYLPKHSFRVVDVGGGTGPYSFWLSSLGHEVYLLDPVEKHIRIASERNENEKHQLASLKVGEAGGLPFPDRHFDVVLLMGPLYHLPEATERHTALLEANRVLKSNGMLFSAHISRFASLLDGYRSNLIGDPEFQAIVIEDLSTGRHRGSADGTMKYFTDAYLQRPDEIEEEAASAGFQPQELLAIEGFGWLIPGFEDMWKDPARRADLLRSLAQVEKERSLIGVSAHLMLIARKKQHHLVEIMHNKSLELSPQTECDAKGLGLLWFYGPDAAAQLNSMLHGLKAPNGMHNWQIVYDGQDGRHWKHQ